ncbi:MAG: hypothetical protein NC355_03100 [Blautia sp.]|nr:hypothetical protein [Blautia sp.]
MRREIVIGICFVAAGVLCTSLFGYDYFSTYGFLNAYHIQAFSRAQIDLPTLLANIVWKRGELFGLIWIVSYTPIKRIAPLILRCALFFTAGMFAGACMINMGIYGLVVFLGSWIPHGPIYLAAIILMFRREFVRGYGSRNETVKRIVYGLSIFSLLVIGCVAEATVGIRILQRLFGVYQIPTAL